MTVKTYGTGQEIWNAALDDLPRDRQSAFPDSTRKIQIINDGMDEAQGIGYHHHKREVQTFQDGTATDTYYELTDTNPRLFKLLGVKSGTGGSGVARTKCDIIGFDVLEEDYRSGSVSLGSSVYVFAVNPFPAGQNLGVVRVEMYPDAPAAPGVDIELFYEYVPYITTLSATVYYPRNILEAYLRWKISRPLAPQLAQSARAEFEALCLQDRAAGAVSHRPQYAVHSGYVESMASRS